MMDEYLPQCDTILDEAENCDELVFDIDLKDLHELLLRIELARRNSSHVYRVLMNKSKVIESLSNSNTSIVSVEVKSRLHDLMDNISLAVTKLESAKDTLFQAHSNYLSRTMVEIGESSDISDKYLNIIVILSMLMVPFQTICTVMGMNLPVPWNWLDSNELAPFFVIFSVCVVISLILVFGSMIVLKILERCGPK